MEPMSRKDFFETFVKLIGLWMFVNGLALLLYAGYHAWQSGFSAFAVGEYLMSAMPRILIGLLLVGKSGWVTRICHRHDAA